MIYTKDPVDASPINTNSLFIANQFSGNDWQNNISTYMGKIFRILTPSLDSVSNALLQVNDQGLSLKTDSKGFTSNVDTGITAVQDAIKSINDL